MAWPWFQIVCLPFTSLVVFFLTKMISQKKSKSTTINFPTQPPKPNKQNLLFFLKWKIILIYQQFHFKLFILRRLQRKLKNISFLIARDSINFPKRNFVFFCFSFGIETNKQNRSKRKHGRFELQWWRCLVGFMNVIWNGKW